MALIQTNTGTKASIASFALAIMSRLKRSLDGMNDRAVTHRALKELSDSDLRDVGLTPSDRDALVGPGLPVPELTDLRRCMRLRSGNW